MSPPPPTRDTTVVDPWPAAYETARYWVRWTARRRWPRYAANDDVWAMSAASWWVGGRRG